MGRTHGRFGLEEMVRLKYVDLDLMPGMKKVWWYGYGRKLLCNRWKVSSTCSSHATCGRACVER